MKLFYGVMLILLAMNLSIADVAIKMSSTEQKPKAQVSQCLKSLDKQILLEAEIKGLALSNEVKKLCANRQRNKAQNKALGFAVELNKSSSLTLFRLCTQSVSNPADNLQKLVKQFYISDLRFTHICDKIF